MESYNDLSKYVIVSVNNEIKELLMEKKFIKII